MPLDPAPIFAPVGALIALALKAVRKGGTVVSGGIHMSDIPSLPYADLWEERQIRSVANLTRADGEEVLPLAARAGIRTETRRYSPEQANVALDDLRSGRLQDAGGTSSLRRGEHYGPGHAGNRDFTHVAAALDEARMSDEDQQKVVAFLSEPGTFGGRAAVEVVETHGAYVFLSGEEAIKMKRAVTYDYMDLSTVAKREAMLRRELELNAPAAPGIYRDVVPVTREAEGLTLDGRGAPVEWVLRMWRFPAEDEFEAIAERGALTDALADDLGHAVAAYHAAAPVRESDGAELIGAILQELRAAFEGMRDELGTDRTAAFGDAAQQVLKRCAPLLSRRSGAGHVRRCHGDLHLRNLVLIEGRPVPFDALEFDETLGTCDVLYDLAFLLMDLAHRDLGRAANISLNAYLLATAGTEDEGLAALPLFLAVRAAIRAMVDVQSDRARHAAGESDADARRYLDEALRFLRPPPPRLVAVGGLSGTGKTTVAREIAPEIGAAPGAVHLRSDLERKAREGVDPVTHLPPESYTAAASRVVYHRLLSRAETLLGAGHSVILDAAYLAEDERQAVEALSSRLGIPFLGLWLHADAAELVARVESRAGDASDADAAVVAQQLERDVGRLRWDRIDASGTIGETVRAARATLA